MLAPNRVQCFRVPPGWERGHEEDRGFPYASSRLSPPRHAILTGSVVPGYLWLVSFGMADDVGYRVRQVVSCVLVLSLVVNRPVFC